MSTIEQRLSEAAKLQAKAADKQAEADAHLAEHTTCSCSVGAATG